MVTSAGTGLTRRGNPQRATVGHSPREDLTERVTPGPREFALLNQVSSITGGVTFTFGGLQINTQAQVLNTSNNPIRGLFASGDIVGLFFHNYPSCTGQTRNVVFSRLAGRNAAAQGL